MKYDEHSFYCIKCGNKGVPLQRQCSHKHERFHRKKLYCIYCQQEINHIECATIEEIEWFKENFNNGIFKEEAENSINYIKGE